MILEAAATSAIGARFYTLGLKHPTVTIRINIDQHSRGASPEQPSRIRILKADCVEAMTMSHA